MTIILLLLAIAFVKWGGALARSYEPGEKGVGWVFLLAGLGIAFAAGGRARATPPIVNSPVVFHMNWTAVPTISDEAGYVRTTAPCAVFSDYPSYRIFPAGTVFQMIINPNAHPKGDPSVWAATADGHYMQGVQPIGGGPGFYLPVSCLEGVTPAGASA